MRESGALGAAGIVNEVVVHPRSDREILLAFLEEVSDIKDRWEIRLMVAAARARDEMLGLNE
jgi:hypothetical protein